LSRLFAAEDQLTEAIEKAGADELDGHEIAMDGSDGFLYIYGPSADRLFEVIEPVLKATDFMQGAEVQLRYGSADSNPEEMTVIIGKYSSN
jgi:hypothetical protein